MDSMCFCLQAIVRLSNEGCIESLCSLLTWEQPRIVRCALSALEIALTMGARSRINNVGNGNGYIALNESYEAAEKTPKKRVRAGDVHGQSNSVAARVYSAGGTETLRQLTEHENEEIAVKAKELLRKHFQMSDVTLECDDVLEDGELRQHQISTHNGCATLKGEEHDIHAMMADCSVKDNF